MFIRKEPIEYLYHLGFDSERVALRMIVRRDVFDQFIILEGLKNLTEDLEKEFDFGTNSFSLGVKNVFGFMKCGMIVSCDETDVTILFRIPRMQKRDTKNLFAITVTLHIFFDVMQYIIGEHILWTKDSLVSQQQLFLTVAYSKEFQMYGSVLHADLSVELTQWMRNAQMHEQKLNTQIKENCLIAFKRLANKNGIVKNSMGLNDKNFLLSSLHGVYSSQFGILSQEVVDYKDERPFGYETFCHNLDTPFDQMVHLVGFVTLLQYAHEHPL